MPAFTASAPGKVILFGEHAVVYGQEAIAVPVLDVEARAIIQARPGGEGISLIAPDISTHHQIKDLPLDDAIALAVRLTLEEIGVKAMPACSLILTSTIPIANRLRPCFTIAALAPESTRMRPHDCAENPSQRLRGLIDLPVARNNVPTDSPRTICCNTPGSRPLAMTTFSPAVVAILAL